LDAISPSALAARADAPILLIHGKDDTVDPFEQSEIMEQALKRAGKPVELVTMENEDHWLSRGETRTTMLTSAVAFVEKHNPPD
jgi:dipeptidyl aminopeptidase/acylaminoacyl peptidase